MGGVPVAGGTEMEAQLPWLLMMAIVTSGVLLVATNAVVNEGLFVLAGLVFLLAGPLLLLVSVSQGQWTQLNIWAFIWMVLLVAVLMPAGQKVRLLEKRNRGIRSPV